MFKPLKNYETAVNYLIHELPKTGKAIFRNSKGFERSQQLLAKLGNPQNAHPTIHVAGTSGKGSVCYLIDSILRAHGKKTGLMVSPHVYDIRERIQINGQLVSEKKFHSYSNHLLNELQNFQPTYFEAVTSLGFLVSAHEKLDYLIVETGFGGLWDTTNTITHPNKLAVITQIGFDHTAILGNTIEEIAQQKAGIIQEDSKVIAMAQSDKVQNIFTETARKKNAEIVFSERFDDYQQSNDNLARAAVKALAKRDGWDYDDRLADDALSRIFIPGRFEKRTLCNHLLVLDGAHNPQKLAALVSRIQLEHLEPVNIIFAIGERKDWQNCLRNLMPITERIIATEFFTDYADTPHAALSVKQIVEECKKLGIAVIAKKNPVDALHEALKYPETIVATGSFYLLSEIDAAS